MEYMSIFHIVSIFRRQKYKKKINFRARARKFFLNLPRGSEKDGTTGGEGLPPCYIYVYVKY